MHPIFDPSMKNQEHYTRVFRKVHKSFYRFIRNSLCIRFSIPQWKTRNITHEFSGKWIRKRQRACNFQITNSIKAKIDKNQFVPNVDCVGQTKRSIVWKAQTGSRIVLRSYYPDRHGNSTQQARYYPRKWAIIDISVPGDFNVVRTEDWKV